MKFFYCSLYHYSRRQVKIHLLLLKKNQTCTIHVQMVPTMVAPRHQMDTRFFLPSCQARLLHTHASHTDVLTYVHVFQREIGYGQVNWVPLLVSFNEMHVINGPFQKVIVWKNCFWSFLPTIHVVGFFLSLPFFEFSNVCTCVRISRVDVIKIRLSTEYLFSYLAAVMSQPLWVMASVWWNWHHGIKG